MRLSKKAVRGSQNYGSGKDQVMTTSILFKNKSFLRSVIKTLEYNLHFQPMSSLDSSQKVLHLIMKNLYLIQFLRVFQAPPTTINISGKLLHIPGLCLHRHMDLQDKFIVKL